MRLALILLTSMAVGCAHQQTTTENAPERVATQIAQAPDGASTADATGQPTTLATSSSSSSDGAAAPDAAAPDEKEAAAAAEKAAAEHKAAADHLQKWAQFSTTNKFGETVYCRKELITGSRLQTRTRCLTAGEIERIRTNAQDTLSDLSRRAPRGRMDGGG